MAKDRVKWKFRVDTTDQQDEFEIWAREQIKIRFVHNYGYEETKSRWMYFIGWTVCDFDDGHDLDCTANHYIGRFDTSGYENCYIAHDHGFPAPPKGLRWEGYLDTLKVTGD